MLYSLDYIISATKRGLAQSVDTWKTRSCLSLGERISVMFWNLFLIWCQLRVILKVILFVVQRTGPSAPTGYHLIENRINLMISSNKKCNYVVAFLIICQCCEVWCKCVFMCIYMYLKQICYIIMVCMSSVSWLLVTMMWFIFFWRTKCKVEAH